MKFINLLILMNICSIKIFAQNFNILKDIDSSTSSYPQTFSVIDSVLFFSADDGLHGQELWRSNGTQQGTYLIKDIMPDSLTSKPRSCVKSGNIVFFAATTTKYGNELWKTDGTPGNAQMVKDIYQGSESSLISNMTDVNGTLFFTATDEDKYKIWKTDGTVKGTVPVVVHYKGKDYYLYKNFISYHDSLFFFASYDGEALFKMAPSDTAATFVKKVNGPYDTYDNLPLIAIANNILYFAGGLADSAGLWRTDGSSNNTYLVKNVGVATLISLNDILYFDGSDNKHGNELWKSDGTEKGTVLVKDISGRPSTISNIITFKGRVYYVYYNPFKYPVSKTVYKSDGTEEGTVPAFDFTDCYGLKATNDYIFFSKYIYETGYELWKSDGTQNGTSIVKDLMPGPVSSFNNISFEPLNNEIVFPASDITSGNELWKTNGLASGTTLVKDINRRTTGDSYATIKTNYNNSFFITANNQEGSQPWISDGTTEGTYLLKYIVPDTTGSSYIYQTIEFKNDLYFRYYTYVPGRANHTERLYKTNGTVNGTVLRSTTENAQKAGPLAANNQYIFYPYYTHDYGTELWKTDVTKQNTRLVKDIFPGVIGSICQHLYAYNNIIYFSAFDGVHGQALWRSDGTDQGTYFIKSFTGGGDPSNFFGFKNQIYFTVNGKYGELWMTDGTEAGTRPVIDSVTGNQIVKVTNIISSAEYVYFNGTNGITGTELWKKRSTGDAAVLIKDITNPGDSRISNLTGVNGTVFFTLTTSYDPEFRNALWKTDGTSEGTILLKDDFYGTGNTFYVLSLINVNGKLAFLAYSDQVSPFQYELWQSNGTYAGTQKVYDDNFSGLSIYSPDLHVLNGKLYFTASTYRYGIELWGGFLPAISTLISKN
jgi:ELWxxDGT repeat protein